ncbi:hypothetical protein DFH88_003870 [Clostridium saccharobutylicum]|nr:hypothetical protein [Clostridium saccharobutylicum]
MAPLSTKFIVAIFLLFLVSIDLISIGNLLKFFSDTALESALSLLSKLKFSSTSIVPHSLGSKVSTLTL